MKNKKILFLLILTLIATFNILYYINTPKMISEKKKEEIVQHILIQTKTNSIEELVKTINTYNSTDEEEKYMFISSHSYSYTDKNGIVCKLIINHEIGSQPYKVAFYDNEGRFIGEYIENDITSTDGVKSI